MYGSEENKSFKKHFLKKNTLLFFYLVFLLIIAEDWNCSFFPSNVIMETKVLTFLKITVNVLLSFLLE